MRLLMISFDYSPAQGKKTIFYHMLKEFSTYWDEISIICPKKDGAKKTTIHGNVTFFPVSFLFPFGTSHIYRMVKKLLSEKNFSLISVHEGPPFPSGIAAYLLWRMFKVPYVLEIMHIVGYPKAAGIKEYLGKLDSKVYFRYAWKNAAAIRTINSEEVPEFLSQLGVPKEKILYLPCFYTDLNVFRPLNFEKNGKTVIFSGRLAKNKGLFELIDAFKIVTSKISDSKLLILGDGKEKKKLVEMVKSLKLSENVEFLGWVHHTETTRTYNKADVLVMPSYSEGGPRVCIEAMACGTPVICTKIGIMREIIEDGVNGLFVSWDPRDIAKKIIYMLENPELRERIGQEGIKTVQKFEYKELIKNYAKTYSGIVERKP